MGLAPSLLQELPRINKILTKGRKQDDMFDRATLPEDNPPIGASELTQNDPYSVPESEDSLRGGVNYARRQNQIAPSLEAQQPAQEPTPYTGEVDPVFGAMTVRKQIQDKQIQDLNNAQQKQAPELSSYDKAINEYNKTIAEPAHKQGKAAQIAFQIFRGIENAGRSLQGQQILPFEWLGNAKKDMRDQQAARKVAPFLAQRQREIQERKDVADINKKNSDAIASQADASKKIMEAIRAKNPMFADLIQKQGYVTPEQAKWAKENGFGELPIGDWRKREFADSNGVKYERPETGPGDWKKSESFPEDKSKRPLERRLPDGTPFYTTGDKEADRLAMAEYRQAQLDTESGKFNSQQFSKYESDLTNWFETENKRNTDNMGLIGKAQSNRITADSKQREADNLEADARRIEEDDPQKAVEYRAKAGNLRSESAQLRGEASSLELQVNSSKPTPRPTRPTEISSPRLSKTESTPRTMTSGEKNQLIEAEIKKGKTRTDASKYIEGLIKKEGYTVQ